MSKIKTALQAIKNLKNWTVYFADYLGIIKKREIVYELRNGIKYIIRSGTCDKDIINEVWLHRSYTPKGFEIKDGDLILDIGAHIGIFSVFASTFAKRGKIFAFEPVSENFEILKKNLKINKIQNVTPINKAVSKTKGRRNIFLSDIAASHSFFNSFSGPKSRKVSVPTISLDEFIKENNIHRIDFLKMDCEGAEYEILFNCSKNVLKMIKKISLEYHNIDNNLNVNHLKNFLEQSGFKINIKSNKLYAIR